MVTNILIGSWGDSLYSLVSRLGLIAEHGYWVKPAAAHRRASEQDGTNMGWDESTSGRPPNLGGWVEGSGYVDRLGEGREGGPGTPIGQHGRRRSRAMSGTGPPSPDAPSRQRSGEPARPGATGAGWIRLPHKADLSWRTDVLAILENFTGRTPGSFLEHKDRYF